MSLPYRMRTFVLALICLIIALIGVTPLRAVAHHERPPVMPDGSGRVPDYRATGPDLLVCKSDRADFEQRIAGFPAALQESNRALWDECQRTGYRHLQEAVDQVTQPGINIAVLPGLYLEEPSRQNPSAYCTNLPALYPGFDFDALSWEQQVQCPNNQNLVAILSKVDLQIEGTGAEPTDVVFDANFAKQNVIRADRSNGIYLRNLTAQHATLNAIYIMESDGFVIDKALGRWNDAYGFLTFADDHGLYTDCEAYGNGDSGVYPGAAHDINVDLGLDVPRYAIEIKGCYSHHNTLGYSGTAGDSVWAHDNRFVNNGAGVATDSAFPEHPGMPQNHAKFERNEIGDNNVDYFRYVRDGTCAKPSAQRGYEDGVVCPTVGVPTGTGMINPGGNYNIWRDNWVYGNNYAGFLLTWAPGFVRKDNRFAAQFDTSHHNRFLGNKMGVTPDGQSKPNGIDFWWDGQGLDNCWQAGTSRPSEPFALPVCGSDGNPALFGTARFVAEPLKMVKLLTCNEYSLKRRYIPDNCDWFGAQGLSRIEVQTAAGEASLLAVPVALLGLGPILRRRSKVSRGRAIAVTIIGLAGLVISVLGTANEGTLLTAVGLALLGCWWLYTGLALRVNYSHKLGVLALVLAVISLLGSIDTGLWMLPWTPLSPTWLRMLLEFVWIPWALVAGISVLRKDNKAEAPLPAVVAAG